MGSPPSCHVLFVDRDPTLQKEVMRSVAKRHPAMVANVVSTIPEAVTELQSAGYDAIFLRVEEPGEMALLLRIKASVPATPVFALVPEANRDLDELARESGADGVVSTRNDLRGMIADVEGMIGSTDRLIRRSRAAVQKNRLLRNRMMELLVQGKPIRARSFDLSQVPVADFAPLLIEDDPDQAFLMLRCFERANLPSPLPVMRDGEQAMEYLEGRERYASRFLFPLPTLVIADLHLPKKSGLDVLSWIRSRPELAGMVVFMLTSSPLREDLDQAYALGADYYFTKPMSLDGLAEVVKVMAMRWGLIRRANRP
jgi:CheY-like chemotaxis protein